MKVVIAGGSGFIGQSLSACLLAQDHDVYVLTRSTPEQCALKNDAHRIHYVHWDARSLGAWVEQLDYADVIINLTGRTVDCVKTPEHCDEILRSRVESTLVLGKACADLQHQPSLWIQMSTAHIYGDPPQDICDETSAFGYGLAPDVGRAWEQACADAVPASMRCVILRTSFVMGRNGGALKTLAFLAKIGLGGTLASGRQGMSWIHEDDMNQLFLRVMTDESMQGAYLATAPNPVSNKVFMAALRRAVRMPIGLPAFAWMIRLAAPVIGTDPELAIYGRYCISKRLQEEDFEFTFPELDQALADLLGKQGI